MRKKGGGWKGKRHGRQNEGRGMERIGEFMTSATRYTCMPRAAKKKKKRMKLF